MKLNNGGIMNSKISVIVPVYNAQKTIEKCIKSILVQTYSNLEIIVVNDGSKDKTGEICEEIAKCDSRIKYYYKENTGVSMTRNFGLEKATGDYISFIDSDDFLEKNMYENMIKEINNADILICNCFIINDNKKINNDIEIKNNSYETLEKMIKDISDKEINRYVNPPWNKLIKRHIIVSNNILFDSKISLGEDLLFNLTCMKDAKEIKTIDKRLYNYVITTSGLSEKRRDINAFLNNSFNLINSLIEIAETITGLDNIIFNEFKNIIARMEQKYKKSEMLEFLKLIRNQIINNIESKRLNKKNRMIYLLLKHKQYKIIVEIYFLKGKVKRRNI